MTDTYKTILKSPQFSLFKDKGSKFFGYAYPILEENLVVPIIEQLKREHPKARHWCYAWRLGKNYTQYKINDDGEPSGSAGLPIYGQIQSKELTNVLVVVVRYFGGTKLGVSGLISAYKTAALLVLEQAEIVTKTIDKQYMLNFSYTDMNKVMRVLKNGSVDIIQQKMETECEFLIGIRLSECDKIIHLLEELRCVKIKEQK